MNEFLIKETQIDEVYYFPHYYQEKTKYKIQCSCRKPNNELVLNAVKKYNIDIKLSFFVGDRASDIQTGINSRMKTVLLESGYGLDKLEQAVKPDFVFKDLEDFVTHLL